MTDRVKNDQNQKEWIKWLDTPHEINPQAPDFLFTQEGQNAVKDWILVLRRMAQEKQRYAEGIQIKLNEYLREAEQAKEARRLAEERESEMQKTMETNARKIRGYENQLANLQKEMATQLAEVNADRERAWSQFKERDEKLSQTSAMLSEVSADRERAWSQFKERDEKLTQTSAMLSEVSADRDTAWAQFSVREQELDKLRRKLAEMEQAQAKMKEDLTQARQYGAEMATRVGELEKAWGVRLSKKLHRQE